MPEAIGPLSRLPGLGALTPAGPRPQAAPAARFAESLGDIVAQVDRVQDEAASAIEGLAVGRTANIHEVMLAVNKAELSFTFLMEARNKLVEAYKDIMNMPI